ncbi:PRD domain-containing protein [Corynebacterium cystitidis]|uniref:Transcriptional antiterminator, BglG family n=1 Tax=Corynebacterium cystitidis DSM 20524 TaxID=1121357 RepID=A0A1H9V8C1_9CORY|nr:PRD domain-containing protein [Corynebacterium cystitidis]WJY83297.1 Transcription antiterminator LicT [Corynebacterium cystitidis DSM 20524]SES17664.1 transcriptional antiterminator, BglG family [Corynebacterium cystitidis DSM 20524]SNV63706.1 putative transcription antiterminator [Corynebacterium cystitidis]
MHILRVFNNNVVLAKDVAQHRVASADGEVILTGRGIGFGARTGDVVDLARVQKVFVPADGRDPDHLGEMLAMVPEVAISAIIEALAAIDAPVELREKVTLVTALADHLHGAIERQRFEHDFTYPLEAEVRHLYPVELDLAQRLLAHINQNQSLNSALNLQRPLPDSEAIAFALHFVNAGFTAGDLSHTYAMTGVIQQILSVIGAFYGVELEQSSIAAARFITHMRYLFTRLASGEQLAGLANPLTDQIMATYPRALQCAQQVATIVELRFDADLNDEEIAYLTLHIERLGAQRKEA